MADSTNRRWLVTAIAGMIALLLAGELYRHLIVAPVSLPVLLFELAEELLLVGCAVACALLVQRVRMRAMLVASIAMLALLLAGEAYLGDKPATASSLLIEVVELALLIGCVLALLTWHDRKQGLKA